jgi:hypothetical protein
MSGERNGQVTCTVWSILTFLRSHDKLGNDTDNGGEVLRKREAQSPVLYVRPHLAQRKAALGPVLGYRWIDREMCISEDARGTHGVLHRFPCTLWIQKKSVTEIHEAGSILMALNCVNHEVDAWAIHLSSDMHLGNVSCLLGVVRIGYRRRAWSPPWTIDEDSRSPTKGVVKRIDLQRV